MLNTGTGKRYFWWIIIVIACLVGTLFCFIFLFKGYDTPEAAFIIINKNDMTLVAYDKSGNPIQKTFVATGKSPGNKKVSGDMKTPEGVYNVSDIHNSSSWTHDFTNDKIGPVKGAYGPYFIRLNVPGHKGIGIHGTHDPTSIGKRVTEGCIRLNNEDVTQLSSVIKIGIPVIIIPGREDILEKK